MNKVYKTIWNDAIKSWIAVPEITQSGSQLKNLTDNKINPKNKDNSKKENILRIFNINNIVIILSGLFPLIANAVVSDKLTVRVDDDENMVAVYNIDIYKKYFPNAKWNPNNLSNLYLSETIVVGKDSSIANSSTDSRTTATGGTVVFGPNSVAYGFGNTAFGAGTYVSSGGTAVGVATIANNLSTSVGRSAVAENNGVAIGRAALASDTADGGVAIGVSSKATASNAVAIGRSSVASNVNEVSFGNDTIKRKLTNIDAGSADNDAVNFKQLSTTNTNVAKNTQDLIDTNNALNTAKTDLTKQISDNKTDTNNQITTVNNKITQINNGEIGIVKFNDANKLINVASDKLGKIVNFTGLDGDRKLTGIDKGTANNDAVNVSQLNETNALVAKNTTDIADNKTAIDKNTTDIADNKTAIDKNTTDIADNKTAIDKNTTDIADNKTAIDKNTTDIADNKTAIDKNTTDIADNKTAIADNKTAIDKNTADITSNTAAIDKNTQDITKQGETLKDISTNLESGTLGLVQLSANGEEVSLSDKAKDAKAFNIGNKTLTGVTAGKLSADSTEAVNGSQLHATNQTVIANTTAIAANKTAIDKNTTDIADNKTAIDKNTTDIADNKTAIDKNTTDIADNKTAIDKNTTDIADNKTAIDKNTTDIADNKTAIDKNTADITSNTAAIDKNTQDITKQGETLKDISTNLESGTLGLVQLSANGEEVILSDKAKDAKAFNIGNKTLTGVTAGKLSADSTEAVNGSQLHATNQTVIANTTAIAANKTAIDKNTTDIADNKTAIDKNTTDIADNKTAIDKNTTDIADNKTAIDKNTTDIADNKTAIDKNTTDIADNKTAIDKNTADITSNTAAIDKNTQDITKQGETLKDISTNLESGTLGLVQLSANGEEVILSDKAKDAKAFNIGNKTLTGVTAGKLSADSTEAVNGSQLHATNQTVIANTTAIAANKTAIDKNTQDITKQGNTLTNITNNLESGTLGLVQLSANGEEVILSEKAKDAKAFNLGNKTLNGVKAGKLSADSTEAVNGSQLHATNQMVKTNTDNIAKNTADIADNKTAISKNTQDITENKNAITTITKNIDSGSLGLVQLSADNQKIVLNSKADSARVFEFNNRTLSGVSTGRIAADSTEAVNGSQLHTTNQSVAKNTQKIQENSDKIAQHDTAIAQNTKDIQANTDKLTQHDKMLNQNSQDIKENTNRLNDHDKEIAQSKQDIKANTEKLAEHDSAISKNTSDIQKNTAALDKQGSEIARLSSEMGDAGALKMSRDGESINLSDKAKGVKSINFGDKQLSGIADAKNDSDAVNLAQMKRGNAETLKSANTYTDERVNQLGEFTENGLNRLNTKIDDLDKKVDKGFAANAALSGLFQPYGVGKMNLTAGVGGYKDESAVAVGMGYRINENVAIKGGVAASTGTGSSTMYNASVNFEW